MPLSPCDGEWTPVDIDVTRPNVARVYDYFLGGKNHLPADREAAEQVLAVAPQVGEAARESRAFLRRAVYFLAAEAGIRQFLDLGAGLPTTGNVHEVTAEVTPAAHVVYVDNDPVVIAHGRALLADNTTTLVTGGDFRRPQEILDQAQVRSLIDFGRPVAVLLVAALHFLSDAEDPAGVVAAFRRVMAPGSYLVISHGTSSGRTNEVGRAARLYSESTRPVVLREPGQVAALFDGFDLVPPGVVPASQWRPGTGPPGDGGDHTRGVPTGSLRLAGSGASREGRAVAAAPSPMVAGVGRLAL
jgi:SAM-dependent methyltransferase